MNTSDCLLWVGHRYTIPQFVEEARERGCCRKVPHAPEWLKPGESRVFLAHLDELAPQHGVIFGYFVLGGVDTVVDVKPLENGGYLSTEILDALLSCDGGTGEPLAIPRFRALLEPPRVCGRRPYESQTRSSRNPAIYLVDSLTRDVDRIFCKLVKALVEEELQRSGGKVSAKDLKDKVKEQRLFEEAVRFAQELPRTASEVPEKLEGHAEAHGPLVLFDQHQPYPVFQRLPQAAFRGLIAIDGDQLLEEIEETYNSQRQEKIGPWRSRWIVLPYAQDPMEKLTQDVLVEELAHGCQTNKELAYSFLKAFEDVIVGGLRQNGKVSLFRFGTFQVRERPERKGRHPATGEVLFIPAAKDVQFRSSEKLRNRI